MKDRVSHVVCRAALAAGLASFAFTSAWAGVSAKAYVQEGLVAQYDGIENAGAGTHVQNATMWKDLIGQGGDMSVTGLADPTWDGKGLSFSACGMYTEKDTTKFLCTPNELNLGDEFTIQMFCTSSGSWECRRWDVVPYSSKYESCSSSDGFFERINGASYLWLKPWLANTDIIFTTVVGDLKHRFMIDPIGGTAKSAEGDLTSCEVNGRLAFMKTGSTGKPRKNCYSIRVYNRALTADEIASNAHIDRIRFMESDLPEADCWRYNEETHKLEARVSAKVDGSGTVRIDDGDAGAEASSDWHDISVEGTVTVVAEPAEGYTFQSWLGDASLTAEQKTSTTLTLNTDKARALTAHFVPSSHWIYKSNTISNVTDGCIITVSPDGTAGLWLSGAKTVPAGVVTADFRLPIFSSDYSKEYTITKMSGTFTSAESKKLRTVYLPNTIDALSGQAFDGNNQIETVGLPTNLTSISGYSFRNATGLKTLLPASVLTSGQITNWNESAFNGASAVTNEINLETAQTIGNSAFSSAKLLRFKGDGTLWLTNAVSVAETAFNGVTNVFRVQLAEGTIKSFGFYGCSSLTSVTPFLPHSVTSAGKYGVYLSTIPLSGTLRLSNPEITTIPASIISFTQVGEVDLRGTSISAWNANTFYSAGSLSNVWFNAGFTFPKVSALFNGDSLRRIYFSGDASSPDREQFYNATKMTFLLPRWNTTWTDLLADSSVCTLSEMTAANVTSFRAIYPGEPIPTQRIKFSKCSQTAYLRFWTPDLPTALTKGPLNYTEVAEAEGVVPDSNVPVLFNQTTYALGAADETWTCAAGTEVMYELPGAAAIARGMKLISYVLHQMSAGTSPNVRAPTAWRLYGKLASQPDGDWQLIDEQTMTEESPVKWKYYGQSVATIPPRAEASLRFDVPAERQKAYVAFKFVPSASYQTEHDVADATPVGLEEIEFFGKILPLHAVVDTCTHDKSGWKSLTFAARLLQTGYNAMTSETAAWAKGRIEVSETADFSGEILTSASVDMPAGQDVSLTVSDLGIGADYYARLVVDNAFGVAETNVLAGSYQTLQHPWEARMFVPSYDESGNLVVRLPLPQLFTSATVAFERSPKPSDWLLVEQRNVTNPTDVNFYPVAAEGDLEFIRVTISGKVDGESYVETFWSSSREAWLTNEGTVTTITDLWSGAVCTVKMSGSTLTLSSVTGLGGGTVLNLNCPVVKPDGTRLTFSSLGNYGAIPMAWMKVITDLRLPDTVTSIASQFYDGNDLVTLERLHLPANLETLGGYAFRNNRQLKTADNFLPGKLKTVGQYAFSSCIITNDLHIGQSGIKLEQYCFNSCSGIRRVYFHAGPPASVHSSVFSPMTKLAFFVPQRTAALCNAWEAHLSESCSVADITDAELDAFATDYELRGDEKCPQQMVKIPSGAAKFRYLCHWMKCRGLMIFVK